MNDKLEIPKHWKLVRLGDFAKTEKGKKPKFVSKVKTKDFPIPYINIKAFEKNIIDEYTNGLGCVLCEEDDFLMVWDGSRSGYVGKAIKGALGSTLVKIKFPEINHEYAFYFLQSKFIEVNTKTKGVGIPHVDPNLVWNYNLPLPPLFEQQKIVIKIEELFSELDKSKQQLEAVQQQLKIYRRILLNWAFEGKLTSKEIKEDKLPVDWEWKRLNEVCIIIGGVTKGRDFKGKETIQLPYLRVANVQDGYLDLKEMKTIEVLPSDKEKYKLLYGDILYTEGGDKDKLGRGTIWRNEIKDCIHQNHVFRARPISKEIESKYIAYFSQTTSAKDYFFKHGKQTTNLASINLTILSNLPIPICTMEEQQLIVQEIESRLSVCDKLEETIAHSLQQAEMLRQSILKKAFLGRLVEYDPNDESASILLEKIKEERRNYLEEKKRFKGRPRKLKKTDMAQEFKSILALLQESKKPIAAHTLWQSSEYKDDIDSFYAELKILIEKGVVNETSRKGKESFLTIADVK